MFLDLLKGKFVKYSSSFSFDATILTDSKELILLSCTFSNPRSVNDGSNPLTLVHETVLIDASMLVSDPSAPVGVSESYLGIKALYRMF